MSRTPEDGPRSELARYAYGWSDKKPGWAYWLIIGGMFAYVIYHIATLGSTLAVVKTNQIQIDELSKKLERQDQ